MVSFIGYIALTKSPLTTFFILLFAPEINLFGTTFHRQNRKAKTQSEIAEKSAIEQKDARIEVGIPIQAAHPFHIGAVGVHL